MLALTERWMKTTGRNRMKQPTTPLARWLSQYSVDDMRKIAAEANYSYDYIIKLRYNCQCPKGLLIFFHKLTGLSYEDLIHPDQPDQDE